MTSNQPQDRQTSPRPGPQGKNLRSTREVEIEEKVGKPGFQINLVFGTFGSLVGALFGAIAWAAMAFVMANRVGYMAIGVAFLVGFTTRMFAGKGNWILASISTAFCIFGCVLGATLGILVLANHGNLPAAADAFINLLPRPVAFASVYSRSWSPLDVIFYIVALMVAFGLALR